GRIGPADREVVSMLPVLVFAPLFAFAGVAAPAPAFAPYAHLQLRQGPEAPGEEGDAGDADVDEADAEAGGAEAEGAAAAPAAAAADAPPPAAPPPASNRYNQWHVLVAPGFGYIRGFKNAWQALGPAARIGAWKVGWRNRFVIGGGPSLVYGYFFDRLADDRIHFFTVNGDLIVGGGKPDKIAVYGHLTLGAGVLAAKDGATGTSFLLPGIRAEIGRAHV